MLNKQEKQDPSRPTVLRLVLTDARDMKTSQLSYRMSAAYGVPATTEAIQNTMRYLVNSTRR